MFIFALFASNTVDRLMGENIFLNGIGVGSGLVVTTVIVVLDIVEIIKRRKEIKCGNSHE